MKQDEFNVPIDIFFDRWEYDWDWIKIEILHFQSAKEIIRRGSAYWVFKGRIISAKSPLEIDNNHLCNFFISKYLFTQEIQKHILLHTMDWETPFNMALEMKRISKFGLRLRKVDVYSSH